jgi:hypothetical protein
MMQSESDTHSSPGGNSPVPVVDDPVVVPIVVVPVVVVALVDAEPAVLDALAVALPLPPVPADVTPPPSSAQAMASEARRIEGKQRRPNMPRG